MRETKFRQAAFAYLHTAILYEAAAYVMWRQGLLPTRFGPPWMWLVFAAGLSAVVVFAPQPQAPAGGLASGAPGALFG